MKWVLPWLGRCAGTKDFCPALVAVVDPVQNMFFPTVHYISSFVHIAASWAGSRAGLPVS